MMDTVIDKVYNVARGGDMFMFWFQEVSMHKFPFGPIFIMVAHVAIASMNVFNANKNKPKLYWLHSLVMTVLAAFGGGIITPVLLGAKPAVILSNDLALIVTTIVWFLINYCGFDRIFEWKPIKFLANMLVALWRTNGTINTVTLACNVLKPGPYYPTPLVGPILAGTFVNCLGAFVPFDKGLSPIQKGTPWPIQSAFISAAMYFFIVKDREGFIGIAIRSILGDLSHRSVAGMIVAMQMLTLGAQVVFNDPNANFFTPIHEFAYYVLGLQGPISATPAAAASPLKDNSVTAEKIATKKPVASFDNFAVFVRCVGSAMIALYLVSQRIPPVTLPAVALDAAYQHNGANYVTFNNVPASGLSSAQPIGNCQWKSVLSFLGPSCPTYALRLEEFHHCTNETCRSVAECQTSFSPSACTMASLRGDYIDRASFRLAVHPTAVKGLHGALSSVVRAAGDALGLVNTNTQWSTALPLQVTSSHQLLALDPDYDFSKVSLFLTQDSELYLVSDPQFTGSITDPAKMSARILWHGLPKYTCNAHADDHVSATAEALYLDAHTGVPRLKCSDGSSVELEVGEVYKNRAISMTYSSLSNTAASATVTRNTVTAVLGEATAAGAGGASTKSEL